MAVPGVTVNVVDLNTAEEAEILAERALRVKGRRPLRGLVTRTTNKLKAFVDANPAPWSAFHFGIVRAMGLDFEIKIQYLDVWDEKVLELFVPPAATEDEHDAECEAIGDVKVQREGLIQVFKMYEGQQTAENAAHITALSVSAAAIAPAPLAHSSFLGRSGGAGATGYDHLRLPMSELATFARSYTQCT